MAPNIMTYKLQNILTFNNNGKLVIIIKCQ